MHFGKVWSDHSMLFCQFILSIYSVFHVICFCPIISWISCKPWTETYKCCVFSLIFIIVKLSSCSLRPGTSMALPVSSRPSPSISPSSWRFFCISFHCCLDSTAFVRRISGMAPERFKSPRPKHSYPMLSHAIPCYLQSWFCFGAFWLNNVVLLVSLTVVSSNLSKLIISASAPLISVTSDVLLSAWAFKHLNISIEGHDASTRNWDANKPLTCLLIIACVVGDLFAKKNPCISRSQTFTTETKLSLKKHMRGVPPSQNSESKYWSSNPDMQNWVNVKIEACSLLNGLKEHQRTMIFWFVFFPRSLEWPQLALQILAAQATQRLRRCHLYRIGPHDLFLNDACTCCSK